jgi:hypothetical protein
LTTRRGDETRGRGERRLDDDDDDDDDDEYRF